MNMKAIFTVIAMAVAMALAGCSSHHNQPRHTTEPSSFQEYMKANAASLKTPDNMMKITPVYLGNHHRQQ